MKCHACGKTVFFAELKRAEEHDFHMACFGQWWKDEKARESASRNRSYAKRADVSPQYYRVADVDAGEHSAKMVSGPEERGNPETPDTPTSPSTPAKTPTSPTTTPASPAATPSATHCPGCNAEMNATAKFCPECGKPTPKPSVCKSCAQPIKPGAKFCPECGVSQV
ncbi:hypothetical protein Pelo_14339 [Pelomyxa schiedti]|nr:hypothetical protein Pelo_14339 [Pelomyxa schiedti]